MSDADTQATDDAAPLLGRHLLVVDDSRTVRRSAASYLESAGASVSVANDGFEALAAIVDKAPDALVADIVMPRLDGYHLCALVRHHEKFRELPILLLSSRDGLFDVARASVAGATEHLAKPFDREALVSAVTEIIARMRSVQRSRPSSGITSS